MEKKQPRILQLTTPFERFQKFDQQADRVLSLLDKMGDLYTDLGFREVDVEEYSPTQTEELKEELIQHGRLVLFLLHHPLIEVLRENRLAAENGEVKVPFETPTGIWQHYKGTRYEIIGPVQSTDFHAPAILYREEGKPDSRMYTITLINFNRTVIKDREKIQRFSKVS